VSLSNHGLASFSSLRRLPVVPIMLPLGRLSVLFPVPNGVVCRCGHGLVPLVVCYADGGRPGIGWGPALSWPGTTTGWVRAASPGPRQRQSVSSTGTQKTWRYWLWTGSPQRQRAARAGSKGSLRTCRVRL
jgi:hypothetical protein